MFPPKNKGHTRKVPEKDWIQQRADDDDEFDYPMEEDANPPQGHFIIAKMTYKKFGGSRGDEEVTDA